MSGNELFDRILWIIGVLLFVLICLGLYERGEGQQHWGYGHTETYTVQEPPPIYWDEKGNLQVDILNPYPRQWTIERQEELGERRSPCRDR